MARWLRIALRSSLALLLIVGLALVFMPRQHTISEARHKVSIRLAPVDLTGATTSTKGTVTWSPLAPTTAPGEAQGSIYILNESGCALSIVRQTGDTFEMPPGAWVPLALGYGETSYSYSVDKVLPNAPISTLYTTYYPPGSAEPALMTLGNHPIGVTGTVTTVGSIQTNFGQPATSSSTGNPGPWVAAGFPLTIPVSGTYLALAQVEWSSTTVNSTIQVSFSRNGTPLTRLFQSPVINTGGTFGTVQTDHFTDVFSASNEPVQAGDVIDVQFRSGAGSVGIARVMFILQYTGN